MTTHNRYVFVDFRVLKQVKFKKLEKVCDRIFVFINSEEKNVPFPLVRQMQRFGKDAKWLAIDCPPKTDFKFHITFVMGRMHNKVSKDIEFAILSNDKEIDPLIDYINKSGRGCLRVRNKKRAINKSKEPVHTKEKEVSTLLNIESVEEVLDVVEVGQEALIMPEKASNFRKKKVTVAKPITYKSSLSENQIPDLGATGPGNSKPFDDEFNKALIDQTAQETIQRLIRSGNRPAEVEMLKSYILLHNQEMTVHGNIDMIIDKMQESNEIEIHEQEVRYNF